MGLFDFLRKKDSGSVGKDLVWMTRSAKLEGCYQLIQRHPDAILIAWFSDTETLFKKFLETKVEKVPEIKLAKTHSFLSVSGKTIIFLEHYPTKSKEESLIKEWKPREMLVLNSLDEPLFEQFGSERIIQLMKAMGMEEYESLEHTMITKSISNAQRKLDKKVPVELSANSSREWFKKNMPH
jgi:hypothetical protein